MEPDPDPELDPETDLEPDPDPLIRGVDPRIRIRIHIKMSPIPNTTEGYNNIIGLMILTSTAYALCPRQLQSRGPHWITFSKTIEPAYGLIIVHKQYINLLFLNNYIF